MYFRFVQIRNAKEIMIVIVLIAKIAKRIKFTKIKHPAIFAGIHSFDLKLIINLI